MTLSFTLLCLTLLAQLGSPAYRTRAAAHRHLHALGRLALPALERGTRSPCPERAERCRRLLAPYAVELADRDSYHVRPTRWPRLPWLWVFRTWSEKDQFVAEARRSMRTTGSPDWPEYREATRLWVRSQLLQRVPLREIRRELDRMVQEEIFWLRANAHRYNPPLKIPAGWVE